MERRASARATETLVNAVQLDLIALDDVVANPVCPGETHCGRLATLGPWVQFSETTWSRTVTPIGCACRGTVSERRDQ
jgi:hypothetical protein